MIPQHNRYILRKLDLIGKDVTAFSHETVEMFFQGAGVSAMVASSRFWIGKYYHHSMFEKSVTVLPNHLVK
jgi:hypothetical protein